MAEIFAPIIECLAFIIFIAVLGGATYLVCLAIYKLFGHKSSTIRAIWRACDPAEEL